MSEIQTKQQIEDFGLHILIYEISTLKQLQNMSKECDIRQILRRTKETSVRKKYKH